MGEYANAFVKVLFVMSLVVTLSACARKAPSRKPNFEKIIIIRFEVPASVNRDLTPDGFYVTSLGDR